MSFASCSRNILRRLPASAARSHVLKSSKLHSNASELSQLRQSSRVRGAVVAATVIGGYLAYNIAYPTRLDAQKDAEEGEGIRQPSGQKLISFQEVQKHNKREDCWVIIKGNVYDVTDFLENHPGGAGIILANAGKDATEVFNPLHPPDALDQLEPENHLGPVDPTTVPATGPKILTADEKRQRNAREEMPPIGAMVMIPDFEKVAEQVLSETAWAYYKSASDTEETADENEEAYKRYWFRPRVLRDITTATVETSILGVKSALPIFISPAAMAKLGHPDGEINLTKGAGRAGIIQGISINASCSLDEMLEARKDGQDLFFQIYLNKDRDASRVLIDKINKSNIAGLIFTVDAAVPSKRTRDVRAKGVVETAPPNSVAGAKPTAAPVGVSQAISGYQDPNLQWKDIAWIKSQTKLPIIVKGIQCVEDVALCAEHGADAVVLSNHGGRQLNYAPAPIDVLYELRHTRPDLFEKMEIYIDGGVRSGTDVVKALCLGAKAVGLGRPFLFANGAYGEEGVVKVCEIMGDEVMKAMRMCGASKIEELKPEMVGLRGPWVWPPPMPAPRRS